MCLSIRLATPADLPSLEPLVDLAIDRSQSAFLGADQIASSHAMMGVDHQLVEDGTHDVVLWDGRLVGCGGCSRRATLYGGDQAVRRAGFARMELMATLSGRPLYESCGFVAIEETTDAAGGGPVPLVRMSESITKTGTDSPGSA